MTAAPRPWLALALLALGLAALLPPAGLRLCLCAALPAVCGGRACCADELVATPQPAARPCCAEEANSGARRADVAAEEGARAPARDCHSELLDADDFLDGSSAPPPPRSHARTPLPATARGAAARRSRSAERLVRAWRWPPARDPLAVQRVVVLRI